MTTRQEIADALSTVAGVAGFPKRPSVPKVGDGWPLIVSKARETAGMTRVVYRVVVMLPDDERASWTWVDNHLEPIFEALEGLGPVDAGEPALLESEAGNLPVLHYMLRTVS